MNTVEKGDAFEDRVFKMLKELLEDEKLALPGSKSKIFQKKAYKCRSTGSTIVFDISIETYMPEYEVYSTLWLIECKDYSYPISVDKVRNFAYQIQQVAGHKGLFITTSRFQKGALSLAVSCGMGLAIMSLNNILAWKARRINSIDRRIEKRYFLESGEVSEEYGFLGFSRNETFANFLDYLSFERLITRKKNSTLSIKYLSEKDIIGKVNEVLEIDPEKEYFLHSSRVIEILERGYNIQVINEAILDRHELGKLDINQRTISLSKELIEESPRWRFTLAHEFAHVVLHERALRESGIINLSDSDRLEDPFLHFSRNSIEENVKRMEIQANIFAGYALMPDLSMAVCYIKIKKNKGLSKHFLYYNDNNPASVRDCNNIK